MTRHEDPGFDQRISDWLQDDPERAPAAVVETVLGALPAIRQSPRWPGQGIVPIGRIRQLAVAAALILAVAMATALTVARWPAQVGVSPLPSLSATPTASPQPAPSLTRSVAVPAHYYTVRLPDRWSESLGPGSTDPDTFVGPEGKLTIAPRRIPDGQSQDEWAAGYLDQQSTSLGTACFAGSSAPSVAQRVGQETGLLFELRCLRGWMVVVAVGDRAYDIRFEAGSAIPGPPDPAFLKAILLGMMLDQGPTRDAPSASTPAASINP